MIIILPDAKNPEHNKESTVNTDRFDCFQIRETKDGQFELVLKKWFDTHFSDKSVLWFTLESFESWDQCWKLLEGILTAIKNGDKVFDVSEDNALQNPDLPKV